MQNRNNITEDSESDLKSNRFISDSFTQNIVRLMSLCYNISYRGAAGQRDYAPEI